MTTFPAAIEVGVVRFYMSMPTPQSTLRAEALIRDVPDFPQPGIMFKDITPVLGDAEALREIVDTLAEKIVALSPDRIVGIESRVCG